MKKSIFIIGISSDIGKAIALKFAKNGYNIIGTYHNNKVEDLIIQCENLKIDLKLYKADVRNYEELKNAFEKSFSSSDYIESVVFVSGISIKESLLCDYNIDDINNIVDVNLKGAIYSNKLAFSFYLNKKYGSIINISSIYGIFGGACESAYSATKAGINGLTKALSQECAPFNIRVNAIAPGFIETKMTDHFTNEEKENIKNNTPLKRLGNVDDIANAVFFLSSNDSSFITGQIIQVDGGATTF